MKKEILLKHISDKLTPQQVITANNIIKQEISFRKKIHFKIHNLEIKVEEISFEINEKGKNPLLEKLKNSKNKKNESTKIYIFSDHYFENDLDTIHLLKGLLYRQCNFNYYYFDCENSEPIEINYLDFRNRTIKLEVPSNKFEIRPSDKEFMKKNTFNVKFLNDKVECKQLFDDIPNHLKPAWLALILTYFDYYLAQVPQVVTDLIQIIDDENSWYKVKQQAYEIAKYRIKNKDITTEYYLRLAEKIAHLTDDILQNKANFDANTYHDFVQLANTAGQYCSENHFIIYDLETGFTILRYENELQELIKTTEDFRIFRIIDNVVWRKWDPLNLNTRWLRYEYLMYIHVIFSMIKDNESVNVIAKHLQKLEKKQFGYKRKPYKELKKLAKMMMK